MLFILIILSVNFNKIIILQESQGSSFSVDSERGIEWTEVSSRIWSQIFSNTGVSSQVCWNFSFLPRLLLRLGWSGDWFVIIYCVLIRDLLLFYPLLLSLSFSLSLCSPPPEPCCIAATQSSPRSSARVTGPSTPAVRYWQQPGSVVTGPTGCEDVRPEEQIDTTKYYRYKHPMFKPHNTSQPAQLSPCLELCTYIQHKYWVLAGLIWELLDQLLSSSFLLGTSARAGHCISSRDLINH